MTRKDYERIARALRAAMRDRTGGMECADADERRRAIEIAAACIADTLAADNPRFNRARFLAACGVTE